MEKLNNDINRNENVPSNKISGPSIKQLEQNGDHNVNITNNQGGTVNLNFNNSHSIGHEAEDLMAIQTFSKVYYQLLVTNVLVDGSAIIPANRSLLPNMVPIEIFSSCSELSDRGIERLKTIPAIICQKNTEFYGKTSSSQSAWYCRITDVVIEKSIIRVWIQSKKTCKTQSAVRGLSAT